MGRLRVRDWDNGERAGTSVELEAETLGHDLMWGSSTFVRTVNLRESDAETPAPDELDTSSEEEPAKTKSKAMANS
jgi:single-strand DNA-binding protein